MGLSTIESILKVNNFGNFSLLGRTESELKTILRQEHNLLKKNQEELAILENFVKVREKGPEEKLQSEITKFKEAKDWFQSRLCFLHGKQLKRPKRLRFGNYNLVAPPTYDWTQSKDQMISEMSNISGESEEKLRLELSRMASIWNDTGSIISYNCMI